MIRGSLAHWAPVVVGLACGLLVVLAIGPVAADVEVPDETKAPETRTHVDYVQEVEDGRRIARLVFRVEDDREVSLAIHAAGPRIEDVPGFEAVPGANRTTAQELTAGFDAGRIKAWLVDASGTRRALRLVAGERVRLPRRYLDADGRLRMDGVARDETLTSIHTRAVGVPAGASCIEVCLDGEVRLRCPVTRTPTGVVFGEVEATGGWHRPAAEDGR